jgi:hypothetical protein
MTALSKTLAIGMATVLVLTGVAPAAWGQPAPQLPFAGEFRGIVRVKGYVVCANCTLREVRKNQPALTRGYQLTHEQKQAVMKVEWVNERPWWQSIVGLSRRVQLRGSDNVLQKLWAEENLFEDIEIIGLLRSTRVLDVYEIIVGPNEG